MEYFNQFTSDTKTQLRDGALLTVLGFFVIWWFPLNLLFVHLVTKAYSKDPNNLFSTFLVEFWNLVNFTITKAKELAKQASPQNAENRASNSVNDDDTDDNDTDDNDTGDNNSDKVGDVQNESNKKEN